MLPVFVGCFSGRAQNGTGVYEAYHRITQLLGCAILFFFANVLKTLVAKLMSTHFHKEAHFKKMQMALQKVPPPPFGHVWIYFVCLPVCMFGSCWRILDMAVSQIGDLVLWFSSTKQAQLLKRSTSQIEWLLGATQGA